MSLIKHKFTDYSSLIKDFKINEHGPGFHGDIYLLNLVDKIINMCDNFIETGSNLGNTLYFVSQNYNIKCFSCEIGDQTPRAIYNNSKVLFKQMASPEFIYFITKNISSIREERCFFFLDAHSDTHSVWQSEVKYIIHNFNKYYIIIDDFNIGNESFNHNGYSMQELNAILEVGSCKVFVPDYNEQTSKFHHLTGWVLLTNDSSFRHDYIREVAI